MSTNKLSEAERPFVIDCLIVSIASAIATLIACAVAPVQPIPALLLHKAATASRECQPIAASVYSESPISI